MSRQFHVDFCCCCNEATTIKGSCVLQICLTNCKCHFMNVPFRFVVFHRNCERTHFPSSNVINQDNHDERVAGRLKCL